MASQLRKKDEPTIKQSQARLKREFYRLISDLSFCEEFLNRPSLLAPGVDKTRYAIKSVHILFHSCEECAYTAVARLWEDTSDTISLPNAEKILETLWNTDIEVSLAFKEDWRARYERASSSKLRSSLAVYRDEEIGHNLIDSGKRLKSGDLVNSGPTGSRTFDMSNQEILDYCKESALLLFQTIVPFSEHASKASEYTSFFDAEIMAHRQFHGALLDLLEKT